MPTPAWQTLGVQIGGMMGVWIIEESPTPIVWNVLQSRGIYKSKARAEKAAKELTRWHSENLTPDCTSYGWRYRVMDYVSIAPVGVAA